MSRLNSRRTRRFIMREYVKCPICGKENWALIQTVEEGEPYKELGCTQHCLWIPQHHPGEDFLTEFLEGEKNNPAIRVPEFHSLKLDIVPRGALEANQEKLEKVLSDELHEVDGWWFGTLEEREKACKKLTRLLKPLCDFYSWRSSA
jgi:hypothetical protein